MPATLTEKGPQTQLVVADNQLSFDDLDSGRQRGPEQPTIETWFLLQYYDANDKELRIELSRGMKFKSSVGRSDHGVVSHFEPRILLDPIDVANGVPDAQDQETAADEQIDIPVNRRQAG